MGGKSAKPKIPSYEPYQCCPAKVARGTKLAKATKVSPVIKEKDRVHGNVKGRFSKTETSALKPINKLTPKESKKMATSSPIKSTSSPTTEVKQSHSKAKRGFFGSVVAGLPYLMKV
ncbi:uncharacterized protein LOC122634934 [Vespula pensylvanica]|uniref:uncharacterized protein LOC122634934 n=1 Tax=Vespula pensylvanica TaxID=30213 RepID=UPI001CBA008C|nr:uncharacterized protein LOC122634934 [Vespula pensylvanica]XP_043680422.1 uncharacterized protein LOC122634934 [Vespula pensylvanica]XP_043680423.1 uncharacterized protein LOC122634934 [Vespula pensylvanica]XP_050862760.1 uncharacterized protein LOC127069616 [Vespula vulgaris]